MSPARAPRQMILGVFGSPDRADAVRGALRASERSEAIGIIRLALLKRDARGRLDLLSARTVVAGAEDDAVADAAILRQILGPTGDPGVCSRLYGLADALAPGSSAIAALIEHRWLGDVCALMQEVGPEAVVWTLKAEIVRALADGRDLVLTAGAADWQAPRLGTPAPTAADPSHERRST